MGKMVGKVDWCGIMSTRGHRYCRNEECKCPCHAMMRPSNYGKDGDSIKQKLARMRKVKRIG